MTTATVNSLLPYFADHGSAGRVAADDGAPLVDFGTLRIGAVEPATMLPLVNLDARLGLCLLLALVKNVFGALTLVYLPVHHQVVQQFLVDRLLQNRVVASECYVAALLVLLVETLRGA